MDKALISRAEKIRDETGVSKNTAYRVGALLYDLLEYVNEKCVTKVDFQKDFLTSGFGDSEERGITQRFFTELIQYKALFTNLGIVDETLSDGFSDVAEGYYTYQKGYNEGEVVNGILIVSNVSYPGAIARTQVKQELGRIYIRSFDSDERVWLEWQDLQETFFKSELGNGTDCGLTQRYLSEILGSETTSESEDGSIWGKLISIAQDILSTSHDVSTLQSDSERHDTVRFDGIVNDASIVIEGVTNAEGGEVLFVASKRRFAYRLGDRYYSHWAGVNGYMNDKNRVLADKVYLCGNKTYVYHNGALLSTDDEALGIAITANANAGSALSKIEEISTVGNVMLDQLDMLTDPLSAVSTYSVFYQGQKIGVLHCFTNARADVITQCFEANWDIDVAGNLLPDYNVTELRSLIRIYNISSGDISGEIPIGSWGRWKYNQKVITLSGGVIIE